MILSLEVMPICGATSGAVIIFERKNILGFVDVGHVGVAFKNPNDGTWIGGAVEGPGGIVKGTIGVSAPEYNGGWCSDVGILKTQADVIREFSTNRITKSDGIIPHDAYDRMKFIAVQDPHYDEALRMIQRFPKRGFQVWANNDCLNGVYDVMNAYNVEGLRTPILSNWPKSYFNNLNGIEQPLTHEQQKDSSSAASISNSAFAESWSSMFGGQYDDRGCSIQQTNDGGYIIAGYTSSNSAGGQDVWLIKIDANGNKLWDRTFGGSGEDWGNSVQQTSDGGYIIIGYTASYGAGGHDVLLIKTDANGNELWDKTFGGPDEDYGCSVHQTTDGGYIITGSTTSYGVGKRDVWLVKTDANGNKLWDKTFGGSDDDYGSSVQQTDDGGYIIAGDANSGRLPDEEYSDVWLIKTDADGNKLWDKIFDGSSVWGISIPYLTHYINHGESVQQTNDNGYIVTGLTYSYNSESKIWLIKTDANGNKLWDKTPGSGWGRSIQQTNDSGYILTGYETVGYEENIGPLVKVVLIRTDTDGNKLWERTFGGLNSDYGWSVRQTSDGGYIIAATTRSWSNEMGENIWLIKTDAEGNAHLFT